MLLLLKTTQLWLNIYENYFLMPEMFKLSVVILEFYSSKFPFKVVSNIPYGITSDIFKILMFESLGNFLGGSIVLQLEPTQSYFRGSFTIHIPFSIILFF